MLFGAGIGNATSLPPLIAQSEFARDVARVPLIVAIAQAAYAFAPAIFGALRSLPTPRRRRPVAAQPPSSRPWRSQRSSWRRRSGISTGEAP